MQLEQKCHARQHILSRLMGGFRVSRTMVNVYVLFHYNEIISGVSLIGYTLNTPLISLVNPTKQSVKHPNVTLSRLVLYAKHGAERQQ